MKLHALLNSRNAASAQAAHKAVQARSAAAKYAAHRYERRKVREILRHSVDVEESSLRFEQFG